MKENFGIRSLAVASWWMAAISLWALDGCCSFLVGSGWLLLFPGGLWMGWLLIFPDGLWMVAVLSWWPLDGCYYFLGRPAFWRHRSLASALAQLQIVFAGGCVLPYRNLTPEIPIRVYSCAHSARFSADQAAHGLFLYEPLAFPLCVDAWYCCAACCKRRCRSEASTTALGTTKRSMSVWGDKKCVHMFHCWLTGVGGGGQLQDHSRLQNQGSELSSADQTGSQDWLSLKLGYAVGGCHARRLPSVHEAH